MITDPIRFAVGGSIAYGYAASQAVQGAEDAAVVGETTAVKPAGFSVGGLFHVEHYTRTSVIRLYRTTH